MIKKLLPCIGKYKKQVILTPILVICEVILEIFIPLIMAKIIDVGIKNNDIAYVIKLGILMILMASLSLICGALAGRFAAVASAGFAKGVRKKLFDKIQEYSFANIDKFSTASIITRLTTDVTNTQNAFMMIIRVLVRAPIMLISATILAVSINARLAVIFLIAIPFLGTALYLIAINAHPRFKSMLKKYDRMNLSVQENLTAIRVVKSFNRGSYEDEKFSLSAEELMEAQRKAEKIIIFNMPVMQFSMYACMIAISWFGGNMIIAGSMQTGEFMSFISYVTQILMSLMILSMVFIMVVLSRASAVRIVEVLDEESDIKDRDVSNNLTVDDGSIIFEDVSFSYNKNKDNLVLENINFEIKSGETIGIMGGTGSAKTSLVQLIPRLYDVFGGKIIVGGHDVQDYNLDTLRNQVAVVLQKNVLFSGTIKDNLKWGNENASDKEIEDACKFAEAHDFIMSFPDGYDTVLGQGGVNISGGQKQRICIARALLKKPKIIILDDSTSAVDTATDSKIRKAFKEKLPGTTAVIIAQRITSVCDADRIIVLNEGKIDGIGTHTELLKNNNIYREVYESQQKGED